MTRGEVKEARETDDERTGRTVEVAVTGAMMTGALALARAEEEEEEEEAKEWREFKDRQEAEAEEGEE